MERNHISKHHIYHLIDSPKPLQRLTKADQLAFLSASLKKKKKQKTKNRMTLPRILVKKILLLLSHTVARNQIKHKNCIFES